MRLCPSLAVTAACLSLAACGGSSHSSTTHTATSVQASTPQISATSSETATSIAAATTTALATTTTPAATATSESTTTSAATTSTAGATSTAAGAASTAAGATSTGAGAATTTTSRPSAPPEVPKGRRRGRGSAGRPAASQGAHISTTVVVGRTGRLSPPVVSVPAGINVDIHIANRASSPCTVALTGTIVYGTVQVGPGASGQLQSGALRKGIYQILVNGTPRGHIVAGAQGGP
ncbi:MAG: hypothetical protein ACJ780_30680 [Solirubrobacteraceae bacterium]